MTSEKIWDDVFKSRTWGEYPPESLIRFAAKFLKKKHNIIEVGCGTGTNLEFLLQNNHKCVGVDISSEALKISEKKLSSYSNLKLMQSSLEMLDFSLIEYDVFIDNECCYVFDFATAKKIYKLAYNSLPQGGLMYIKTFGINTWGFRTGNMLSDNYYEVSEGPLTGLGPSRFSSRVEIENLLDFASNIEINEYNYTVQNGHRNISEFVVTLVK
jgi:SAM-dependent methyltransferase